MRSDWRNEAVCGRLPAASGRRGPARLWWLLATLALAACTTPQPPPADTGGVAFVVVRHAEKADAGSDPALSTTGRVRADALARRMAGADLVAIYTTGFRRTRGTVGPLAAAQGLAATVYDAHLPASALAARLKAAHQEGTVLVAGHSNTVPDIVAALCSCEVAPMTEAEFDRISTVRIDARGRAQLETGRY